MRIYLVGYMASGKTQIGKLLAAELNYGFIDMDQLFEEQFRISIADFFEKYGEQHFRMIEHELLVETSKKEDQVIATGGGTPCFHDNMELINKTGLSVFIHFEVPFLVKRLLKSRRKRPVLKGIPDEKLDEMVGNHLAQRLPFYQRARIILDGSGMELSQIVKIISDLVRNT